MNHYLYAIVDRIPAAWRPPTSGLGDASVVPRRVHDIVVLGSLLESIPPANPRTLAVHQEIVATVMDAAALLPLPYGTAVPSGALVDWLTGHRATIASALETVRDRVEMSVKLLRLDRGVAAPALQALADAVVERAALPHWKYRAVGASDNVAVSIAFLVPRAELPAFLARIAPVASHADGVAVVPTGPWPAYSFVPELERAPPARATPPARGESDRRAG
ncbi:MAG TPA: GvpL/GvpF family gas vesicle protein [Methylomirabilota bacterium]|nr:GvpL/GvpF family gas vesicle protein [Methylomirabilota bacterium]